MKKILAFISALTLVASPLVSVVSCTQNKDKPPAPEPPHPDPDPPVPGDGGKDNTKAIKEYESKILKSLESLEKDNTTFSYKLKDLPSEQDKINDAIENFVSESLIDKTFLQPKKYKQNFNFSVSVVDLPVLESNGNYTFGSVNVKFRNGTDVIQTNDGKQDFLFKLNCVDKQSYNEIINQLKIGGTFSLSKIKIPQVQNFSLDTILSLLPTILNMGNIPDKVPSNSSDWKKWDDYINMLNDPKGLFRSQVLSGKSLDDIKIKQNIDPGVKGTIEVDYIKIDTDLKTLLNVLAIEIIHLKNYLKLQATLGNKNLILNIIRYLLGPIENFNDDNYSKANKKWKSPETHLDALFQDIIYGVDVGGRSYSAILQTSVKLNLWLAHPNVTSIALDSIKNSLTKTFRGLLEEFFINNNLMKNPSVKLEIAVDYLFGVYRAVVLDKEIPIRKDFEKYIIPALVEQITNESFRPFVDDNAYKILAGEIVTQYSPKPGSWYDLDSVDTLLKSAKNIRLVIKNLKLQVTSKKFSSIDDSNETDKATSVIVDVGNVIANVDLLLNL